MIKENKETLILISEERLKELLDKQVDNIAELLGEIENRICYRICKGVRVEMGRQLNNQS